MRAHLIAALLTVAAAAPATAQTSRCYWVGNVWTCEQSTPLQVPQSTINWGTLANPGDIASSAMESFNRARQQRAERERIQAETEFYRAQTETVRSSAAASHPPRDRVGEILRPFDSPATQSVNSEVPDYFTAWIEAAKPRMGLYPEFEKVVTAPEVNITPDMVRLMTSSPLAADIAYYLATHRAEATAISQMPLLEAARAIDRIERELKTKADN